MPELTAIIPTRDRLELLGDCLATLAAQQMPVGTRLEVVIVDDGSDPPLDAVLRMPAAPGVDFRMVRQEGAGANIARNVGVRASASPIVAFLDDDTLVGPAWAAEMMQAFALTGADGVAGRIHLKLEGARPRWLVERAPGYLSAYDEGETPLWMPAVPPPVSANCAVTRGAFDRVGGFDGSIDRVGGSLLSGGETEFYRRIVAGGGSVVYWPRAVVEHRVAPSRLTVAYFKRRGYAQGLTDGMIEPPTTRAARLWEWLRLTGWLLRTLPIAVKGLVMTRSAASAQIWLAYCGGRFAFLRGRLEARA